MFRVFASLAIAGACWLFAVSCGSSEPAQQGCSTEADCRTDEACVNRQCVKLGPDSGSDATDAAALVCVGKQGSPTVGQNCGCPEDCDSPELCLDEVSMGVPGGICLRSCAGAACPGDLICLQSTPGAPGTESCFVRCTQSSDCPKGNICQTLETGGELICAPLCQSDSDCPATGTCDRYSGLCASAPLHPNGKETGDPCVDDVDCKSEFCLAGVSMFPDGYCTAFCSLEKQGCPDGSYCMPVWSSVGDEGLCMKLCTDTSECRTGYGCVGTSQFPGVKVCGPPK